MFVRLLQPRLAATPHHILLLGARQVGKTTLTRTLQPDLVINLADEAQLIAYARDLGRFRRELKSHAARALVVVDEVQRLPALLNMVQALSDEGAPHRFILTGSSARKLRHSGVNLLPGRIILEHLDPLLWWEMQGDFDLERALQVGCLPGIYLDRDYGNEVLVSYVAVYLREEIRQEAAVRNVGSYARFLDSAAEASGGFINFSKFASDTEIPKETARRYFDLLVDTLVAFRIPAFKPLDSHRRVSQRERYIFFDLGVRNAILGTQGRTPTAMEYGDLFEQWVILQCIGYIRAQRKSWRWYSYRTQAGAEVDLILDVGDRYVAIECKWTRAPREGMLRGLASFKEIATKPVDAFVVCRVPTPQRFFSDTWALSYADFFTEWLPAYA